MCAEALDKDAGFVITRVMTPEAKLTGRKQLLTENPLHLWAREHNVPVTVIHERIDQTIKAGTLTQQRPDILLVVDFGYFIPRWLLEWPVVSPLNIHPSQLPRWRGSSPGQFPILYGDASSAVTLMIMNEEFDAGPILSQLPFAVEPSWTAREYYDRAFTLMTQNLPDLLRAHYAGILPAQVQPETSPTATATKLSREDGRIGWELLHELILGTHKPDDCPFTQVSPIVLDAFSVSGNIYEVVERAIRAFSPWPGVWTELPPEQGGKRLKILSAHLETSPTLRLELDNVQLEGKLPSTWKQLQLI